MVKVADGQTDLLSKLLASSEDAQGEKIKWEKQKTGGDDSVPAWRAEVENDDGSKTIFSLDVSQSLARIGENRILSEEQKKKQEERSKKTSVRDGEVHQPTLKHTGTETRINTSPKGEESIKEKENSKKRESDKFTESGSKIR